MDEPMVINKSAVREIIQKSENRINNVTSDYLVKLNQEVLDLIIRSIKRAEGNKRQTVMEKDL